MAEIGQEPGKETKGSRTRTKIRNKARGRIGKRKASTKKKPLEEAFRGEDAAENGAELLKRAAGSAVGRNSEKLANLLLDKAMAGDLNSTKLLVTLAERKKPRPEPQKETAKEPSIGPRLLTLAEKWAAEPQWEKDDPEFDRDVEWDDEEEGAPER